VVVIVLWKESIPILSDCLQSTLEHRYEPAEVAEMATADEIVVLNWVVP